MDRLDWVPTVFPEKSARRSLRCALLQYQVSRSCPTRYVCPFEMSIGETKTKTAGSLGIFHYDEYSVLSKGRPHYDSSMGIRKARLFHYIHDLGLKHARYKNTYRLYDETNLSFFAR